MPELSVSLTEKASSRRLEDRRIAIRYPCDCAMTCSPVPQGEEERWIARVFDLSSTGIGLIVDRYFEPETLLEVQLADDNPILQYTFLVQVVHARPRGDEEWLLGCAFARELSAAELRALL